MPDAYYFIITPLNYLFAVEAKGLVANSERKHHMVVLTTFPGIIEQLQKIIDESEWDSVTYRPETEWGLRLENRSTKIKYYRKSRKFIDGIVSKIGENDEVWVGNIGNPICRHVLSRTPSKSKFILDDGLETVNTLKRVKAGLIGRESITGKLLRRAILPDSKLELDSLTYFSIFEKLDFSPFTHLRNPMTLMKRRFEETSFTAETRSIFVGQYLPKANIISREHFVGIFERVRDYENARGVELDYYTHRNDTTQLPDNWKIVKGDVPIEILLMQDKFLPLRIWSFYSTALTTLKTLYGNRVECIYIRPDEDWIQPYHRETLCNIYSYLEEVQPLYGRVMGQNELVSKQDGQSECTW